MPKNIPGLALALAVTTGLLAGCSHTLNGAQQDTSHDAIAVSNAALNAGTDAQKAAADAKAKAELTPAIKLAIIRDPILNDKRNLINVTSGATTISLAGHVVSADMVQRATQDAQKVLTDHHATQMINNTLAVSGS